MGKSSQTSLTSEKRETLLSWIKSIGSSGVKDIKKSMRILLIQLAIFASFQLIFWWNVSANIIPAAIHGPIVFLTATYNDVIPKTLYWVILFTFGRRLFNKIKSIGFAKAMAPVRNLVPELKSAYASLGAKAVSLAWFGVGVGLIIANNFASYSRFSGARNKFDKYFIAILISFTISYLLGEGRKHWIFKFTRLLVSDVTHAFHIKNHHTDNHTYVALSGFIIGLLADAPLILMKSMYGGYYLGLGCIALGLILIFSKVNAKVPG